ncbi:hypothetical protein NE237_017116 [Protea cynaroides]|uniref:Uncharacterized protein n=1 Tax=Protea cynaroides TaxID=273540 RepID=A0A9Q0K7F6_9MAGN|nr:hypothetical protein NE237_017116 [Protea cynaroides]
MQIDYKRKNKKKIKSFLRGNVGSKKTKKEEVRERRGFESEEERVENEEREEEEGVATVWCDGDRRRSGVTTTAVVQRRKLQMADSIRCTERDLVGFPRHRQIYFDISLMAIYFLFSSMERSNFLRVSQFFLAPVTQLQVMVSSVDFT